MSTTKIRNILINELDSLVSGKTDVKRARAVAEVSAQAIYSTRVELENKRMELELAKSDDKVKTWMSKDFSKIPNIKDK